GPLSASAGRPWSRVERLDAHRLAGAVRDITGVALRVDGPCPGGQVGARHPGLLDGDDAVHADFQPGNFLAERGRITGVVDWDGAARGDRRLDLVTLRFGLHAIDADARAVRHYTAGHVEHWLDLAEQRLA
ncbi:MAG TPA: phosphotransferase, partial [Streptosporangiaceae bacterium]